MSVGSVVNIQNNNEATDAVPKTNSSRNIGELGKDDFLKLLVTQLKYQDPLSPMDDKEFIAQMAQFSALEQMQNLNSTFSTMKALSMVGKYITASKPGSESTDTEFIEGIVDNARIINGNTYLEVNGVMVSVDEVTSVSDAVLKENKGNILPYASLIGLLATGYLGSDESDSLLTVTGTVRSVEKDYFGDFAIIDGVDAELCEIISGIPYTTSEDIEEYLLNNINNEVALKIRKPGQDTAVEVYAVLNSYEAGEDGAFKVILDGVRVPVDSITKLAEEM